MTLQDSDTFLVNRAKRSHSIEAKDLMATVKDDDLMLISRGGQAYRVTGAEVKDSFGGIPIDPDPGDVTSSPDFVSGDGSEANPYILQTTQVRPANSSGVSVEQITIAVAGARQGDTVVWTDNSVGADNRFTQPTGLVGVDGTWTGKLVYDDKPPKSDQLIHQASALSRSRLQLLVRDKVTLLFGLTTA